MLVLALLLLASPSWGFVLDQTLVGAPPAKPSPSQKYPYHVVLDEKYELFWNFNTTHITFEVLVEAKGYVAFGLSPNGGMADADIVIGWVKDGQAFFTDRHSTGHSQPIVDTKQDWFLIRANETGEYTSLTFVRKLVTCDPQDRPILTGTTKVIFSYSPTDPTSNTNVTYHGPVNRGSKALLLLDPTSIDKSTHNLPNTVRVLEFKNAKYSVPLKTTTYRSQIIKLPYLSQKHHLIRYEPLIEKGHDRLIHHIILYACNRNLSDSLVGLSFENDVVTPPEVRGICEDAMVAWSVGGSAFEYPTNVGTSLGTSGDPFFFRMETHYNNPEHRSDIVDSSGISLTLTTVLRTHDAGVFRIGLSYDRSHIVPPLAQNFLSTGYCQAECLSGSLGDKPINVFAIFLHAHELGTQVRARHFRDGKELPPISEDLSYDTNFQETRDLKPERVIRKGDFLVNECLYDSRARKNVTYGGLGVTDEMCMSFLFYYPRTPLTFCISKPTYNFPAGTLSLNASVESLDWTKVANRNLLQKVIDTSDVRYTCRGNAGDEFLETIGPHPNMTNVYRAPDLCSKP